MSARSAAATTAVAAAYVGLAAILVATRAVGLGRSLWHDEVVAVVRFIREGPGTILAGPDLSHELFAVLAWATSSIFGESEIVLRLWSVVPFLVGVAVVTAWLHVRVGALSGILFLTLAAASPMLLDITRQARGYGLAFLAMAVLVVTALEATRSPRLGTVALFCCAGVVGTWTLPQFGFAFVATCVVLMSDARMRRAAGLGLGLSLIAIFAWYSPHWGEIFDASRLKEGVRIEGFWLPLSPFQHLLIPALFWIDGTIVKAGAMWLPLVLLMAVVMAASPLLHRTRPALVLVSGVAATMVGLWLAQASVVPRYLSFLLVPLFILLATGAAATLGAVSSGWMLIRSAAALVVIGLAVLAAVFVVPDVLRYPREAPRDAAEAVAREDRAAPVLAYVRNPDGLDYYLDRPVTFLAPSDVRHAVCAAEGAVLFVIQPYRIPEVPLDCLGRDHVRREQFRQYTRGGEIVVWIVPPA
jgi:hypothetical protein